MEVKALVFLHGQIFSYFDFTKRMNDHMTKMKIGFLGGCLLAVAAVFAQGPRPGDLGASKLDIGEPGIAWYTTWETGKAEAQRSGRPIMFVAAATQCRGVSGVF